MEKALLYASQSNKKELERIQNLKGANEISNNKSIQSFSERGEKMIDLRPKKLNEFVGKEKMKEILQAMINGAKQRNDPLEHMIFYGGAGLGKTTLANIVANELGVEITTTVGNMINQSITATLTNLKPKSILFIDEIHRIEDIYQELLYSAMEDFKTFIAIGKGNSKRTIEFSLLPFTLIGATTNMGLLSKPLRDRCGMTFELDLYSLEEIIKIIIRNLNILNIKVEDNAISEIAKRSRFTPRIANNLLKRIRDFSSPPNVLTVDQVKEIFSKLEIDEMGLDVNDKRILKALANIDEPMGINNIASSTNIDVKTIEEVYEPYLLQQGIIARTLRGRMITEKGKSIILNNKVL